MKTNVTKHNYTHEDIIEYKKCMDSIEYFSKYITIPNIDKGFIPITLNDFQTKVVNRFENEKSFCECVERQSGKNTIAAIILLHESLLKEYKVSAIMSSKVAFGADIIERILDMYERLPDFLKSNIKIVKCNKTWLEFSTGGTILAVGSNENQLRGRTISNLYIDNGDYISNLNKKLCEIYPCIASDRNSRLFSLSTPPSMELFGHVFK